MDTLIIEKPQAKVLIVKPSSLGDIVHSIAFLDSIKRQYPHIELHWVVAKGFEGILEGHPLIKKLWVINKDEWKNLSKIQTTISGLRGLFSGIKAEEFDYVVDLQGLLRSGIITRAARAPIRIGFKEAREGSAVFYTHRVEVGRDVHAVDKYLKVAAFLGCDIRNVYFPFPPPLVQLDKAVYSLSEDCGRYAVLVPGARWKTKRWPARNFGELAAALPIKSVIIGSRGDMHIADEIVGLSGNKAISLAGKTGLKDLIEVIRYADFVVCNDTGPMHIAAALGVHVFAIFGPSSPVRTGPYGDRNTVIRSDIPCSPCYNRNCKNIECMTLIEPNHVIDLIDKYIENKHKTIREVMI